MTLASLPLRKKYVVVGTGGRCRMFIDAIRGDFADHAELVGFCDTSVARMRAWNDYLQDHGHGEVPTYPAERFDDLITETEADVVIVTTVDATHHTYIVRAMELGCDVVSEKPMTTDAEKIEQIFEAIERTGRTVRVAFNYRWQPAFSLVQEVVASGRIGTPTLVDFQWRLDTSHGADYFRRWHREKKHSGGLLVHKSTHHFDLVNWILDDRPDTLYAQGNLAFYGEENAKARGQTYAYDRYRGHADAQDDPFALDIDGVSDDSAKINMARLYLDAEEESGYIRDRNVFGGEDQWPITAEDTMTVSARYTRGALLNYSLVAYCPWEGERLTVTGTEGQVEYFGRGAGHIIAGQSDEKLAEDQQQGERYVRVQRMFEPPEELEIPDAPGAHGGGDAKLLRRIFIPDAEPDPQRRDASHVDGAWSVLTGVAANRSIETGQAVAVDQLVSTPMGTRT
ncbi:MAG: Gfo/Idh/MocA family oxidoreductase [Planctomycetota bacterium]